MRFSAKRLVEDIGGALETWDVDRLDLHQLGALFRKSYAERGVPRLVLSVLAGRRPRGAGMLRRLVLTVHEASARRAKATRRPTPPPADTQPSITLLYSVP